MKGTHGSVKLSIRRALSPHTKKNRREENKKKGWRLK